MPGDKRSRYVDIFLIVLIITNVIAVMLESEPALSAKYKTGFFVFELFSVLIFSVEYILRVWSCVEDKKYRGMSKRKARFKFAVTLNAITDLVAILPFYLLAFYNIDLRFLRVLRLRRGFKLTRYSPAMSLVIGVIKAEARAFLAILFLLLLFVILASSFIYLFESKDQPEVFGTIQDAMDWSVRTLTTVGGADGGPQSIPGKLLGFVMSLLGIVFIAVFTGLLASSFFVMREKRREDFRWAVEELLVDHKLPGDTKPQIEYLRKQYGFSKSDSEALIADVLHQEAERMEDIEQMLAKVAVCPHCGENISHDDHKHD